MFGPTWDEGEEAGENCIMRSITICTPHQTLLKRSNNVKRVVFVVPKISLTKARKHTDINLGRAVARTSNHVK
jgi:hypothetical protein